MISRSSYQKLPYFACFLVCVAIDLYYFPATTVFPDEQRFLASATRLAASGEFWVGSDRAWEMPGTALFFAPAVWAFGAHGAIVAIRIAQAVLLVVQCTLIASIARRAFGKPATAFVAACVAAFYPFFWFYQGLLLSETLFNTLLLSGVAALFWWRDRGMRFDWAFFVTCLFFAAATLTKATLTLFPPLLLAVAAWTAGAAWRRTIAVVVAASCLYAAFISPWWIRNATVLHTFVPFTTSSAMNLYLGNNRNNPNVGIDWAQDAEPDVVAAINALPDELARQHAYAKAARDYIESNPMTFVRAAALKFLRFWNVVPNASEYRSRFYALISVASFGSILILALVCVLRQWRRWRILAPIYLIIGYFTFIHIVTIASLRYRFPIEPLLIVMAAEPLAALIAAVRGRLARSTGMAGHVA
ncbi:glycosyltransferase family 39 protein [Microbacteriaceae bacterium K1510]|nr:glycosyltransferase family 39 protein [Microbacteriaceae bacterium K1510]